MSEATVKALTDAIYDALVDHYALWDLDNEQVYEAARLAAQTIESAGTTKAIVRSWLEQIHAYELTDDVAVARRLIEAIREVSS